MGKWQYSKGLHDIGNGIYAYLQPDGAWGWSNAGLIVDSEQSLLVDTLFDLNMTKQMLDKMRDATHAAQSIETVVNTHANGDHCWGNQLVKSANIVASKKCAHEMQAFHPNKMALLMGVAKIITAVGPLGGMAAKVLSACGLKTIEALITAAPFVTEIFGHFDFKGIDLTCPNQIFEKEMAIQVGDKPVQLIEVGPAHTQGDVMVYSPSDKIVFTGDILFAEAHPIIWAGPVSSWMSACDRILDMDVDVIVPGHGPIADKKDVRKLKEYLTYLHDQARKRYDAGMSAFEAAQDIVLDDFSTWSEAERIVVNVETLYREFNNDMRQPDPILQFAQMAKIRIGHFSDTQPLDRASSKT